MCHIMLSNCQSYQILGIICSTKRARNNMMNLQALIWLLSRFRPLDNRIVNLPIINYTPPTCRLKRPQSQSERHSRRYDACHRRTFRCRPSSFRQPSAWYSIAFSCSVLYHKVSPRVNMRLKGRFKAFRENTAITYRPPTRKAPETPLSRELGALER